MTAKRKRPKVAKSKMGDAFNATNTRYATAIAIVYDTICCPCCTCPEHRSGKIRSEIRFDSMPPTQTFRGWAKHVTSFPLDRERGNGPMNAKAVKARAEILAELIGVPLEDETR